MWRQRLRVTELKEGDRNTKYFQRKATWRRKKNSITKLKDESGNWVEDKKGIQDLTTRFFKNLYTTDPNVVPSELVELTQRSVGDDLNEMITKKSRLRRLVMHFFKSDR